MRSIMFDIESEVEGTNKVNETCGTQLKDLRPMQVEEVYQLEIEQQLDVLGA